jgi:eukaryotic-like serine/threonine-protein kinase
MMRGKSESTTIRMPDELDKPSSQMLERKLATILSADVAEFSRLMGEDEEQTLRTFRGHKQVFESLVAMHRGRVFNTAGDAILAEFGSAVDAVRCATDIQAALRSLNDQLPPSRQVRFRIGINLGDVMLHGQDLLGDGVNVAARLQTAAAPGGVCISGSVHDQIRNKLSLSFQSLGEMSFKNIQLPVRTFSITEADGHGTLPSPKRRRVKKGPVKWIAAGAVAIVIAAAGAAYLFLHKPAPKLTDKDTIVLADFTNTTGDPVFDGALRQGLSAQLEQSPFLSLISDERIAQTLGLMAQSKDARLTKELSREVCQRTASAATIEGSISNLGSQFVLGLKAVNCHNGDLLAQEQVTANGKEQVLKALGDAATKLREKLGESLASVQKYVAPPENVTTPSLEALQAYSLGYKAKEVSADSAAAIPFFHRAINLDPNFAMAYMELGLNYSNLDEPARAAESMRKAYELRERTSEREKLTISSHYEAIVTGNLEAARGAYDLWAQTYPRDDAPHINLAVIYFTLGNDERGLTAVLETLKLNPRNGAAYEDLVGTYLNLNRLDDARATAGDARAHNHDGPWLHQILYLVDFVERNMAGMEREAAELTGKPGYDDVILYLESDTAAYGGEFAKARELTRRAADSAQRMDQKETAAGFEAEGAVREALVGNLALAKQEAHAALALTSGKNVEALSAIALGLTGDSAQSARMADDLNKRFPEDTVAQTQYLPMIRAAVALRTSDAGNAVEALAAASPYELGQGGVALNSALYPAYLRGEVYLAAKMGTAASVEFQKILDHPGVVLNEPIGALAHLGLGRAYALSGDNAKAKTAYQDFFALWKNADPDIPILLQAKAEYAKLK